MSVENYIKENVSLLGDKVYIAPDIPEKKLNNAILSIAEGVNPQYVLAIIDTTLFGSAKEGIVFLGDRLFVRNTFEKTTMFNFSDILEAEYVCEESSKDNGKVVKSEKVLLKLNDGIEQKLSLPSIGIKFEELANFINGIINEGGEEKVFETTSQTLPLSDMDNGVKSAYINIICNYAYSDDDVIDAKEYAEIVSLIVRIDYNAKDRLSLRSYMCDKDNIEDTKSLIEYLSANVPDGCSDIVKKSLMKDIIYIYKLKNDMDQWKNDRFILELQNELNINDEQIELIISVIKNDENILNERKNDSDIVKSMKDIGAKAGAVGVPLAAVYFSGSVLGMSAAGLTSGLATLGMGGLLGFSSMFTGIGVVALIGVGTYKGIKKVTGLSDLENNKQRELMLQEIIKNSQKSLNYLIEDVNEISKQLIEEINKGMEAGIKIKKLSKLLAMMSNGAKETSSKINYAEAEAIIAKLPKHLDKARFEELTNEPTKEKLRSFVLSCYIEKEITVENSDNTSQVKKVLELDDKQEFKILDQLHSVLESIGYMNIKDATLATAKSAAKSLFNNFLN
ncbi:MULTISPECIES: hypothetical protein [Clostridium]|jgi:hypothetical protein|uniref:hypothetical protein n=1 Tax=Clostridium TaxID=1485 RepID=UPI0011DCD468|nr:MULTISPECIES: hypothetical protein [Clostridium]MDU2895805.1 hypothetical protein [Clostridium sp.]MDU3008197.1 hypothetical protein [Clostridium sp.]MDU3038791.1 hypothetical protein [Clostridium sp.]MDU3053028.1 hypothetical protein [Clostridium sp.]